MNSLNNPMEEKKNRNSAVTLMEVLVAIILVGIVILGFFSIDVFSRHQTLSTDRRLKLQNQVSFVLNHMDKHIRRAIGSITSAPITVAGGVITIMIDSNNDGRLSPGVDQPISYSYSGAPNYTITYTSPAGSEIIGRNISSNFNPAAALPFAATIIGGNNVYYVSSDNFITIRVAACHDPDENPHACGTDDNPQVDMTTRIQMPSVSVH